MSKIALTPNASGTGTFTLAAPNSNTSRTITLPDEAGEVLVNTATGINVTGNATFGDNDKAIFGAGSDLQIYHNSSNGNSYIEESGTGDLRILANNIWLADYSGQKQLTTTAGAETKLYYNSSSKLATTSTGVDITGTLTSDGLTVDGVETPTISLTDNSTSKNLLIRVDNSGGEIRTSTTSNDDLRFATNGLQRLRLEHNGDISFYEDTGTTPKFFWDASAESLGIGTSSPSQKLDVRSGSFNSDVVQITGANDGRGLLISTTNRASNDDSVVYNAQFTGGQHIWEIAGTERMRIDSSGNLLVGTTDNAGTRYSATSGGGTVIQASSYSVFSRQTTASNQAIITINNTGVDAIFTEFLKDGSTVGSISVSDGDRLNINSGSVGLKLYGASKQILASNGAGTNADNVVDLGSLTVRFDDIYATNGTIQTSDRNEKQDIEVLSDAETRVAQACKGLLRKFRWQDAVAEKGDDARIHFGIIAQDLQDAFTAEGLDAGRYAMFISSTWWEIQTEVPAVEAVAEVLDDEGNVVTEAVEAKEAYTRTDTYETQEEAPEGATERTRLGVRYPELLAFIIAAI